MSNNNGISIEDIISLLDQFDTHMTNFGKVVANYRKSLVDGGVPEDVANDLVFAFQDMFLSGLRRDGQ